MSTSPRWRRGICRRSWTMCSGKSGRCTRILWRRSGGKGCARRPKDHRSDSGKKDLLFMSDLYDNDFVLWSECQSELLRRLAAGEPVNESPDWPNIVEEIESLGKRDKREVRSCVATILLHLIKLQASPASEPREGWEDTV